MEGEQLTELTRLHCKHWAAPSTADAQAALQALERAGLSPHLAAMLWLRFGPEATEPAYLETLHQLAEAGVPAQQLELFGAIVAAPESSTSPMHFAGSMTALHALLGGDWRAAANAAAERPRLLQLASQPWTAERIAHDQEQIDFKLRNRWLLDLSWADLELLEDAKRIVAEKQLQNERWAGVLLAACQQLAQTGLEPGTRLAIVEEALKLGKSRWDALEPSLTMLHTLLGSWQAVAEAGVADFRLLDLPSTAAARRIVAGLSTAGLEQNQLLELVKALPYTQEDAFVAFAEQQHGGDWRAAALAWLQASSASLDRLWRTLQPLQQLGLEVANEHGRERMLQFVDRRAEMGMWYITVPHGTPAAERRAAVEAALEAEGFRAVGGRAAEVVSQLAEVRLGVRVD